MSEPPPHPDPSDRARELPAHPDSDDVESPSPAGRTVDWTGVAVVVVIGVLFAALLILHLTGVVGPGGH